MTPSQRALEVIERALAGTAPRSEGLALFGRALFLSGNYVGCRANSAGRGRDLARRRRSVPVSRGRRRTPGHDLVARDALINLDALKGDTDHADDSRAARAHASATCRCAPGTRPRPRSSSLARSPQDTTTPLTLGLLAHARWLTGDAPARAI